LENFINSTIQHVLSLHESLVKALSSLYFETKPVSN